MKHFKPKEAHRFLAETPSAVFIDCRSEMEFYFVGHPVGAHHVPWNDGPDWEVNPHFVGQVKKVASMNRPIVLICRSGHRSLDAAVALEKAGFGDIYHVQDGFEGPLDEKHHRGTLSGWRGRVASAWMKPTRSSRLSPMPTMPPQQTAIPAARTCSSVSSRSWKVRVVMIAP